MNSFLTNDGFTLIELIIVILLVIIISAVVAPRWTGTSLNLEFEARRVLNDIRYVQALSMTTGQRYRFTKLSANTYQLNNEAGTAIVLPSGGTQATLATGIALGTLTNLPNSVLVFDSQGIPYVDTTLPGTALAGTAAIPLTAGGQTRTVSITPNTGFGTLQ